MNTESINIAIKDIYNSDFLKANDAEMIDSIKVVQRDDKFCLTLVGLIKNDDGSRGGICVDIDSVLLAKSTSADKLAKAIELGVNEIIETAKKENWKWGDEIEMAEMATTDLVTCDNDLESLMMDVLYPSGRPVKKTAPKPSPLNITKQPLVPRGILRELKEKELKDYYIITDPKEYPKPPPAFTFTNKTGASSNHGFPTSGYRTPQDQEMLEKVYREVLGYKGKKK